MGLIDLELDMDAHYVLAFSGGVDSVVLLDQLYMQGYSFSCVHVNHGISEWADTWEEFCREVSDGHYAKFYSTKLDVDKKASEAELRDLRYKYLREMVHVIADEVDMTTYLLTAHHLDDQYETSLMNFIRGNGAKSVAGIKEYTVIDGVTIIRPMLNKVTKKKILAFAYNNELDCVTDKSNFGVDYTRNRLRNNVIPEIVQIGSLQAMHNSAVATANHISTLETFMFASLCVPAGIYPFGNTQKWGAIKQVLDSAHNDYQMTILRIIIEKSCGVALNDMMIEEIIKVFFTVKPGKTKNEFEVAYATIAVKKHKQDGVIYITFSAV